MIYNVLKGIEDDKKLSEYIVMPKALIALIHAYNALALVNTEYKAVDADTTGSDLKELIDAMETHEQIKILHEYIVHHELDEKDAEADKPAETPEEIEKRKLRVWITKLFAVFACIYLSVILMSSASSDDTIFGKIKKSINDTLGVIITNPKDKNE